MVLRNLIVINIMNWKYFETFALPFPVWDSADVDFNFVRTLLTFWLWKIKSVINEKISTKESLFHKIGPKLCKLAITAFLI